ncbi:hypothetical protein RNZ50_23790 [Paracoccaceae bacterium Fryx2]|nr:hypothetical protein [Paracoccaceae bacterium Fryx2]
MSDMGTTLERHLDAMHAAVLAGDLATLTPLGAEVEALVEQIGGIADDALIQRLRQKAGRNAACLLAALNGLRAARRRIGEVKAVRAGMATYDGQGRRISVAADGAHLTRRV